ncbi:MAG TPA: hypothetical protein VF331_06560 [Polyangiales bacterium]
MILSIRNTLTAGRVHTLLLAAAFGLLGSLAVGCGKIPVSPHAPLAARAADKQLTDIPAAPVAGKINGAAFKVADARVRIITMEGRERVDILLSDSKIERCGLPLATHDRRVWLRWPGKHVLDGAPIRVEVGQKGPISVHYEQPEDRLWLGHGGGAALLSVRDDGFGAYKGAVWACFDDTEHSCVSGQFEATACRSELNVDDSVWGSARLDAKYPAIGSGVGAGVGSGSH